MYRLFDFLFALPSIILAASTVDALGNDVEAIDLNFVLGTWTFSSLVLSRAIGSSCAANLLSIPAVIDCSPSKHLLSAYSFRTGT